MPSPDQSSYNGLTLYDRTAAEIMTQAVLDATAKLPNWQAHPGKLDTALMEILAVEASEMIYAINRLPDGIMENLIQFFGIERLLGNPPTSTVTLTAVNTTGYALPAGIQLRLDSDVGTLDFVTTAPLSIAGGSLNGTVEMVGLANTDDFNGLAAGASLVLVSPIAALESAVTASVISGGAGPETDNEWRTRTLQLLQSLSSVLVLPDHFSLKALTSGLGVGRAKTKDNWNVSSSATGHVTVAVADDTGTALGATPKANILSLLDSLAYAALQVHVVDPDINQVDVVVSAVAKTGYVASTVQASVAAAINSYLSPASWGWGETVRINELISLVDQVDGVDYVSSVSICLHGGSPAASNLTLTGPFPLADAADVLVSVTGA